MRMEGSMLNLAFLALATSFFFCFCYGNEPFASCVESEKRALLSFKQDLKDPSNRLLSWDAAVDCCKWTRVFCNNTTGHVKELRLQNPIDHYETDSDYDLYLNSQLGGSINHSLVDLKHLIHLDLSGNNFGGIPIPSFIGSLVSLTYLNLSQAGFGGVIPSQLGNLSSLSSLSLSPSYELEVENLHWVAALTSLEHLDLSGVNLRKAPNWLEVINHLSSLVELHLSSCGLDHIPPAFNVNNFTHLTTLGISDNQFDSLIPWWIFDLTSLVHLDLRSSGFHGPIPDAFGNLTSLRSFVASYMPISSLPNSLFSLKSLTTLYLSDLELGKFPQGLMNMTSLRFLDLSLNGFKSTIPDWLFNLSHLELLDLSLNKLQGQLPKSLGSLCNLRFLVLSVNNFKGEVSEVLKNLFGCTSSALESLELGGNKLFGLLTDQVIGHFKNLRYLDLRYNLISGPIPSNIGRLTYLTRLDLSFNQLNGSIPESIGRLTSLITLYLSSNQLNGGIPESIGRLTSLIVLDLSFNQLEGVVSEAHFANLTVLKELYATGNKLILQVSPNWVPHFQLSSISFRSWHLGPTFPKWLRYQKYLLILDLSQTGISDNIPNWFWNLSSRLICLNLSHNQIQGNLPNIVPFDLTHIVHVYLRYSVIDLSSNQLNGSIPQLSPDVSELYLSNNLFSEDIFHFLCEEKLKYNMLEILDFGQNLLSGRIPNCWKNWPMLQVVKLDNNQLKGKIPNSMGFLDSLQSLHLRNNRLSGAIPSSLQNCRNLVAIDLSENEFDGSIPKWIGKSLSYLRFLSFRSNRFGGKIPPQLCNVSYLQILDLAHNNLFGAIPRCINNFKAMVVEQNSTDLNYMYGFNYNGNFGGSLENAFLVTKGREDQYNTILRLVTFIDLSNNKISEEIPEELTSLLALRFLNLSGNHLTGRIPEKIDKMVLLESIDFSNNQLVGSIPSSMSDMSWLSYLNLSYNSLKGKIPTSTQLQSFNASSFIGNKLCGPPLTVDCTQNDVATDDGNAEDNEDGEGEVDWFYVMMAIGFVVGFSLVCGPLLYSRTWRAAYFLFLEEKWNKLMA